MKKLLALSLALIFALALAACGKKDAAPSGNNDSSPDTTQSENNGGEENDTKTYVWPSSVDEIKWTGAGKIVGVNELAGSDRGEV